ncbi:MAG: OmpA family protein [Sulfurovaceae bacterium]|nr:OmpA family protein [Sulfurovaceae bacterium]
MKRKFSVVVISFAILISGCAQKKVSDLKVNNGVVPKVVDSDNSVVGSTINSNSNGYENVDLYGQNNNSGAYQDDNSYGDTSAGMKNIYFDVDQYIITPDKLPTIINNAKILSGVVKSGSRVKIEGHCDASGTDEYNYALGLRRARSAKEALIDLGINSFSITMVSMGESSPACTTGYSSSCYAQNRRVEFKVIR